MTVIGSKSSMSVDIDGSNLIDKRNLGQSLTALPCLVLVTLSQVRMHFEWMAQEIPLRWGPEEGFRIVEGSCLMIRPEENLLRVERMYERTCWRESCSSDLNDVRQSSHIEGSYLGDITTK